MMRSRSMSWLVAAALLCGAKLAGAQASGYPALLPPESAVRAAIEDSPRVRVAREQIGIADAHRVQLDAGPYEWTVGATGQQRRDAIGATFSEQAYELGRTVRWFGKARLDRQLGEQTVAAGEHAFADAWHEAARELLAGWFAWLRAVESEQVLASSVAVLEEQLTAVQARVRAGDASRLEESLTQAELDRATAARLEGGLRVQEAALQLKRAFPALELARPETLDVPERPGVADEAWIARIVGHNHEIELAAALQEQAKIAAERASLDRIPDPSVALRFSNNFDGNDRVVGIAVSVPIGGARRRGEYAKALNEKRIAEQRAREARLNVEAEAAQALAAMRTAYARWERMREVAEGSAANAARIARGYGHGEFTISEALNARRQALESTLAEISARLEAFETYARVRLDAHEIWTADPSTD